jgi:hypothetical protein
MRTSHAHIQARTHAHTNLSPSNRAPGPSQGARQAFEDAHQLTLALQRGWPDVSEAIKSYEVSTAGDTEG